MVSGLTIEEKQGIIVNSLLPMLKNDLRKVVDSTCADHGRPGQGPNFTATMLCMVACEVVGCLSSDPALENDEPTLDFLRRIADQSGDNRYRTATKAIITYFRHGLVHSFLPKQPTAVKGRVEWAVFSGSEASVCVDFLASPEGAGVLAELRPRHLEVRQVQGVTTFAVVPQVLYVDVTKGIESFERALLSSHAQTLTRFNESFEKWWGRVSDIRGNLDATSRQYLRIQ